MPKSVRIDTRQSANVLDSGTQKQWCFQCFTKWGGAEEPAPFFGRDLNQKTT